MNGVERAIVSGATKDYSFAQKAHWRRTIWNEVLRRTNGQEKDRVVLYLSGPDDLDRDLAISKGVPPQNLVAIDRDTTNVDAVRQSGMPAVRGDVFDVLTTWPKSTPPSAVVLDLCQGLQRLHDVERLIVLMCGYAPLSRTVLAMNLLRGRDSESNEARSRSAGFVAKYFDELKLWRFFSSDMKHRGMAFVMYSLLFVLAGVTKNDASLADAPLEIFKYFLETMSPRTYSYRSGALVFDSVVLNPIGELVQFADGQVDAFRQIDAKKSVALSTAATLAVRTRRIRAAR